MNDPSAVVSSRRKAPLLCVFFFHIAWNVDYVVNGVDKFVFCLSMFLFRNYAIVEFVLEILTKEHVVDSNRPSLELE